ncbi:unnamed protein product [Lactuca saligna]|uniref:Uncharacterized protein n=1 Tax=Lactuca saligna TaxID=75948 RepID=A0AA35UMD8_LACSI|nr:unnamed protein product [Lactuca saligna]
MKRQPDDSTFNAYKFCEDGVAYSCFLIVVPKEVGPKEVEVVKEEQKKKDEELERLKLYQDEFNRIEGKKRDKEAIEATLRILWLEWTMKRMQDVAIKKVRKNWLEPNSLYLVDLPLSESIANKMLQIRRLGRTHQKVN